MFGEWRIFPMHISCANTSVYASQMKTSNGQGENGDAAKGRMAMDQEIPEIVWDRFCDVFVCLMCDVRARQNIENGKQDERKIHLTLWLAPVKLHITCHSHKIFNCDARCCTNIRIERCEIMKKKKKHNRKF